MSEQLMLCELYGGPYDGREVYVSQRDWISGYEIAHSNPVTFEEFEAQEHGETIPITVAVYFPKMETVTINYGFGITRDYERNMNTAKGLPVMSYGGTVRK